MQSQPYKQYPGIHDDLYGGMTDTGKIIRDAWVFGIIPETETCKGWLPQGIEKLWEQVQAEWEKYGFRVANLPDDLRERFERIQAEAIERARARGWNPENYIDDDE
ncbi:MAG: hypothetical protein D6717_02150 [Gammaproteobacteria bacterium]|nr:MAG: hypothetical protein D6717_02150 [Gammaproteobacteria bacterium]